MAVIIAFVTKRYIWYWPKGGDAVWLGR